MEIAELWSPEDHASVVHTTAALHEEDLLGAILATEKSHPDARAGLMRWIERRARLVGEMQGSLPERIQRVLNLPLSFKVIKSQKLRQKHLSLQQAAINQRGSALMITALWLLIARRHGVAAKAVPMPGHPLVSLEDRLPSKFVAPSLDGRILAAEDCKGLLFGGGVLAEKVWHRSFLEPTSDLAFVSRILGYRARLARREDELDIAARFLRQRAELLPERAEGWLAVGELYDEMGALDEALEMYARVVQDDPNSKGARRARLRMTFIGSRLGHRS